MSTLRVVGLRLLKSLLRSSLVFLVVVHGVVFTFDRDAKANLADSVAWSADIIHFIENLYGLGESYEGPSSQIQTLRLYSPWYELTGRVAGGESIAVTVSHATQGYLGTLSPRIDRDGNWTQELSLSKQTLYEGSHTVQIKTLGSDGSLLNTKMLRLEVAYDRIRIGETTLYLDPHHVPSSYDDDFLWETTTLQGEARTFLTYGCDTGSPQLPILIQSYHQRRTIDACLSFSIPDQQLLIFDYQVWNEGEYLYTISTPEQVVRDLFSLFIHYDGIVVMNLPFWDQENDRLMSLAGRGDDARPSMRIKSWEGESIVPVYDIQVDQGRVVTVQTPREKIRFSMYTQRDRLTGPVFPGSYYDYALKSYAGQRRQINAGPLTGAYPRMYGLPDPHGTSSTFGFDLTLDDGVLYVFDGFQDTVIDLSAIGTSIQTQSRDFEMNREDVCDTARVDIIASSSATQGVQGPSGQQLMLVGDGWHVGDLRITHAGSQGSFVPDQLKSGYLYHALDQGPYLRRGTNIYMIGVYDSDGNQICQRRIAVKY